MGFCRRCGDIVVGTRCKCGGTAVAPVLQWSSSKSQTTDKWSLTYLSKDQSTRQANQIGHTSSASQPNLNPISSRTEVDQTTSNPPASRFPRPNSYRHSLSLSSPITSHINSVTRPPSPLKQPIKAGDHNPPLSPTTLAIQADILQAPNGPELSKAYGSVLQPKESLAAHCCAICLTEFQPDSTIYPDPVTPQLSDRFLCRSCFIVNGGAKGDCPVCHRSVLILKSEGGFVETSGRVWHKKCFKCDNCHKYIGDTPMVDLLGRPSCADCFDTCLKRNNTPKKSLASPLSEKPNFQTLIFDDPKSRGGSPAIDELEQRLGIMKSREGSPVLEELTQRLNAVLNRVPKDSSSSMSPSSRYLNQDELESSPFALRSKKSTISLRAIADPVESLSDVGFVSEARTPTPRRTCETESLHTHTPTLARPSMDAIEEMKSRFMNHATSSPMILADTTFSDSSSSSLSTSSLVATPSRIPRVSRMSGSPALRHAVSSSSLRSSRISWTPSTPDLVADISDTLTQSSGPSSPPSSGSQLHMGDMIGSRKEPAPLPDVPIDRPVTVSSKSRDAFSKSSIPTATLSPLSLCAKCGGSLFATGGNGRFVTVPELSASGPPKTYHVECFRCALCDGPFKETVSGQAIFVRGEGGACHIECAPPEKTQIKSTAISSPVKSAFPDSTHNSPLLPLTNTITTTPKLLATGTARTQPLKGSPTVGSPYSSSRYERPPPSVSSFPSSSSRFGCSSSCPGCQKPVSPMEMGVVPGPQGSRWHSACLACGGKGAGKARRDRTQPGCGKRLDSAAKRDTEGGVWCRECLLLLPLHMRTSQVESPIKPLTQSFTGRSAGSGPLVAAQFTGTTTIARQFTGRGGGDGGIARQLTGGALSRQLTGSPTKQVGLVTPRPRPKSVIGVRSGKSVDEGRGMFLVRQMTGGGGSFAV